MAGRTRFSGPHHPMALRPLKGPSRRLRPIRPALDLTRAAIRTGTNLRCLASGARASGRASRMRLGQPVTARLRRAGSSGPGPVRTRARAASGGWRELAGERARAKRAAGTAPTPGRAACRALSGGSPLGAAPPLGQQARTCRQAVPRRNAPPITVTARTDWAVRLAPGILSPRKDHRQGRSLRSRRCRRTRSASPTLDPAATHLGLAPMRTTGQSR
jgi:hypothetical protein